MPAVSVSGMSGSGLCGRFVHIGVLVICLTGPCSISWSCVSTIKASAVSSSPSQILSLLLRFFGRFVGAGVLMVRSERKNGSEYKDR